MLLVSVHDEYQISCGSGKKSFISYTNQVLINSSSFSAGGDSGSLIVSNDGNFNPVALLFAGSSSTTIANPIGEVLTKLGTALDKSVSFGGGGGTRLPIGFRLNPYFPYHFAHSGIRNV